jgi:pilus assembly protein CpaD
MTIASPFPSDRARPWLPAAVIVAGGLMAALTGCAKPVQPYETTGAVPDDYRLNHPIAVEEQVETLDVPVGLYSGRLNDGARGNVVGSPRSS